MSVIASTTIDNDEDLAMPQKLWDQVRENGFEKGENSSDEDLEDSDEYEEMASGDEEPELDSDGNVIEPKDSDEESEDDEIKRVNAMAEDIDYALAEKKEYEMNIDRRVAKEARKLKDLVDQHRQRIEDVSEDEALDNADLMSDGDKYDEKPAIPDGKDQESSGDSDMESEKGLFVNPLAAAQKKKDDPKRLEGEVSEGEWSDQDEDNNDGKGKKKTVLGKRKRKDKVDDVADFFKSDIIQEVPANDPGTRAERNGGYDSMDSDDIAETRILARKMLRKKERNEIINSTYSRFAFNEDPDTLPDWFREDEAKAYVPNYNASKEEMAIEKESIKEYNARPSKKVEQAKHRKKKRLAKAMEKIKKRAQVIAD